MWECVCVCVRVCACVCGLTEPQDSGSPDPLVASLLPSRHRGLHARVWPRVHPPLGWSTPGRTLGDRLTDQVHGEADVLAVPDHAEHVRDESVESLPVPERERCLLKQRSSNRCHAEWNAPFWPLDLDPRVSVTCEENGQTSTSVRVRLAATAGPRGFTQ